jgi:hypothetical protein
MLGHSVRKTLDCKLGTMLIHIGSLGRSEDQWRRYQRSEWFALEPRVPHTSTHASTVLATQAIANVVKTSFGPSGLDKMMVDDIGVCLDSSIDRYGSLIRLRMSQ